MAFAACDGETKIRVCWKSPVSAAIVKKNLFNSWALASGAIH